MSTTSALDVIPLWAVGIVTFVGILIAAEVGYRTGRLRLRRTQAETDAPIGGMVAAELGLLALMLALTFSLVATRVDDRRYVVLNEANAIGTCYLRAAMLPPEQHTAVRRYLREYVDLRLAAVRSGAVEQAIVRSEELHGLLWTEATNAAEKDPRSVQVGLFVQSLNDVIDLHAKRMQATLGSRLPETIWVVLFCVAMLSFGGMGYHAGMTGTSRSFAILSVALSFALVIWLIADLERPHQGLLRVSQQPLIDLQKSMVATP